MGFGVAAEPAAFAPHFQGERSALARRRAAVQDRVEYDQVERLSKPLVRPLAPGGRQRSAVKRSSRTNLGRQIGRAHV